MATTDATYDVVVLGSTLAGLSATLTAARRGQKVLLVEAGTIAGFDFVETLAAVGGWALPANGAGELAAEIFQAAAARKIIVGDRCDLAAFSCLLQDFLARSGAAALYLTDVTGVTLPTAGKSGFTLTLSNRSGIATVRAERLIDATLEAVALRGADLVREQPAAQWAFRGLLVGVDQSTDQTVAASVAVAAAPETGAADLQALPGRYSTDLVLTLQGAGPTPEIGAARVTFLNRVAALREQSAWKPFTLSVLANLVAATPRLTVDPATLERLEAAGFSAVAAWRPGQADLATAPWAAVQAGVAATAGQLAHAK